MVCPSPFPPCSPPPPADFSLDLVVAAYQSALLTTPLLVLHFLVSLLFWRFLKWIYILAEIGVVGFMV